MSAFITIFPQNKKVEACPGQNLFLTLAEAGISLNQACGGQGFCGKCQVRLKGKIPPPSELDNEFLSFEELTAGTRLACGVIPVGGEVVELNTAIPRFFAKPQLKRRVFAIDPWSDLKPSDLVLAVDLGTTNVVGYLLNPFTGQLMHSATVANGQAAFGADIMARLTYASHGGTVARQRLQRLAMADLENLVFSWDIEKYHIKHAVAVMNTAMTSFLLNWDPDRLGRYPCEAKEEGPLHITLPEDVRRLGRTKLHLPPVIGGFVGSDTVAAMLTTMELQTEPPYLILDIGTNAEVVLVNKNEMTACSCAAGPAFEGAGITQGMRAMEGAIDNVTLRRGKLESSVIGDKEARGITGSGLFSLLGELLRVGALDRFGMIIPQKLAAETVIRGSKGQQARVAPRVAVSEHDIQQFMLAKAATRAGVEVLLADQGITPSDLTRIVLCGTFAKNVCADDVIAIGLAPSVEPSKIRITGNAATEGAAMMACSHQAFLEACRLAERTRHFSLSGNFIFKQAFEEQMCFG